MTSTMIRFSVIWMCETCIPSGKESKDVPSITTSLLVMKYASRRNYITLDKYTSRQASRKPPKWS